VLPGGIDNNQKRVKIHSGVSYRYWSLRSYNVDSRLRLDSLRFYGETTSGTGAQPTFPPVLATSPPPTHPPAYPLNNTVYSSQPEEPTLEDIDAHYEQTLVAAPGLVFTPKLDGRRLDTAGREELEAIFHTFFRPIGYTQKLDSIEHAFVLAEHAIRTRLGDGHPMANRSNWPLPKKTLFEKMRGIKGVILSNSFDYNALQWWNHVTTVDLSLRSKEYGLFALYPLRIASGAISETPAHSIAVALALATSPFDLVKAEEALLKVTCRAIECFYGLHAHTILDESIDPWYFSSTTFRDDYMAASWLLSVTVAPTVNHIIKKSLFCASKDLCYDFCSMCERLRVGNSSVENVVRAVEEALVLGKLHSSDPLACCQSETCIREVAERAAKELNTIAFSGSGLAQLAAANAKLVKFVKTSIVANESFTEAREERQLAIEEHYSLVAPLPDSSEGRRLEEPVPNETAPDIKTVFKDFTTNEKRMYVATAVVRESIVNELGFENISFAHAYALQTWAMTGGIGHGPNNTGVCADPQLAGRTISCRTFFKVVGMILRRMRTNANRVDQEQKAGKKRRKLTADSHRELKDSVDSLLKKSCCAKFEADGRVECGEKYCEIHSLQESAKRAAHILRRLDDDHARGRGIGSTHEPLNPALNTLIENMLLPDLHYDSKCRTINKTTLMHGGPTRWECLGKSFVYHAAKHYGLDPESVASKMHSMGFSAGQSMQSFQKAAGMFREVRSAGDILRRSERRKSSKQANAKKVAADLLRDAAANVVPRRLQEDEFESDEEEARYRTTTRGTASGERKKTHGFAHVAKTIVEKRSIAKNVTKMLNRHFKRFEQIQHRLRLENANSGRVGMSRFDRTPRASNFHYDNIKQHFINPSLAFEVVQADEGSFATRFRRSALHLNELVHRWQGLHFSANLVDIQRRRARDRRLSEDGKTTTTEAQRRVVSNRLYDELERQKLQRHQARAEALAHTPHGRRMSDEDRLEQTRVRDVDIPNHALSWVHDIVDWNLLADEWTRLHAVFAKRNQARLEGQSMRTVLETHATGYKILDDHTTFAFSKVGDSIRRMWHRKVNGTDEGFLTHTASSNDNAGRHHPPQHGRVRRLAESFLGPVVAVPYAIVDSVLFRGTFREYTVSPTAEPFYTAILRYAIFSTVGCYLVKPKEFGVSTQIGEPSNPGQSVDGANLKVLRVDAARVCFPAIPVLLPSMPSWREFTKSEGVVYSALTYEEFCTSDGYQQYAKRFFEGFLSMSVKSEAARWIGVTGALRGAEAIDSIENFVAAGRADEGESVIGFIMCGVVEVSISSRLEPLPRTLHALHMCQFVLNLSTTPHSQLGGVLYVLIILALLTLALPLIQVVNWVVGIAFDITVLLCASGTNKSETAKELKGGIQSLLKERKLTQGSRRKNSDGNSASKKTTSNGSTLQLGGTPQRANGVKSTGGVFSTAYRVLMRKKAPKQRYGEVSTSSDDEEDVHRGVV